MLIYMLTVIPALALALYAQYKVRSAYSRYSQVASSSQMTGAQVARQILDDHGLFNIGVEPVKGKLSDHYDPQAKVVRLSEENYYGHSLAATAIAAHEVGHALQDAEDYAFLRFRHSLVPVANFGTMAAFPLIIAGLFFGSFGSSLLLLGIILFSAAVLFQVITLPVEFNASSRAMQQVVSAGIIRNEEERSTRKVLDAAALTYVAAALTAVLELLRLVYFFALSQQE